MNSDLALSVEGLVKTFDLGFLGALPGLGRLAARIQVKGIAQRVEAVRGVTFEVERGEIFGFLGPNGAGKTTTMKMLMGLISPTAGSGTLLGHPLGHRAARAKLGFLPEHPYFYEYLKPTEFLDFYGRLFALSARERKARARQLIDRVGLTYATGRPLRKFSKGMIQRIGIAQALMNDPDLVVFDEPMSGLDPIGRKDVRDIIFELRDRGKTVFFSSHILQDAELICDRVALLVKGRVQRSGRLSELLRDESSAVEIAAGGLDGETTARLGAEARAVHAVEGGHRFELADGHDVGAFLRAILDAGGQVVSVAPQRRSLEDLFVATAAEGT